MDGYFVLRRGYDTRAACMNALMLLSGREALPQSIKDGMSGFELFGFFLQEGSQMGALGQERLHPESCTLR